MHVCWHCAVPDLHSSTSSHVFPSPWKPGTWKTMLSRSELAHCELLLAQQDGRMMSQPTSAGRWHAILIMPMCAASSMLTGAGHQVSHHRATPNLHTSVSVALSPCLGRPYASYNAFRSGCHRQDPKSQTLIPNEQRTGRELADVAAEGVLARGLQFRVPSSKTLNPKP